MRKATVAIEDRRFYEHGGVDYEGIARALWKDVAAGKVVEGGSTITQQLVRNLYISKERTLEAEAERGLPRDQALDKARSKDWILAQYMNQVYYGNHAYGIEAAAQTYFSKHARDLNLAESALLAGLPQAPSVYDPFKNPRAALARAERRAAGDARQRRHHATRSTGRRSGSRDLRLKAGQASTRGSASRTSSATCATS